MARDIQGNKRSIYRYDNDKRKTREDVNPLQKEMGNLVTQVYPGYPDKAEVFNDIFCLSLYWQVKGLGERKNCPL